MRVQITSLVPSEVHHQPDFEAARRAGLGQATGFDTLRSENRARWDELWKGRVQLLGASRWDLAPELPGPNRPSGTEGPDPQ